LARAGFYPVVVDDLRTGHRSSVRWGPLVETDLADKAALGKVFETYPIAAVIHFAGSAYVGESMGAPQLYFRNNVVATLSLLDTMLEHDVTRIVFSSSCATYGHPRAIPITEEHPQQPVNPYGESKLMVEKILFWYARAYGLRYTILRYFNAAGADPDGELGEMHEPEPHLIPRVIAAALGSLSCVDVYGTDYDTADGTAVRDYIHVSDLAEAHVSAMRYLESGGARERGIPYGRLFRPWKTRADGRCRFRISPAEPATRRSLWLTPRKRYDAWHGVPAIPTWSASCRRPGPGMPRLMFLLRLSIPA
jgi:UDP-glucose-4-epimerase GalE